MRLSNAVAVRCLIWKEKGQMPKGAIGRPITEKQKEVILDRFPEVVWRFGHVERETQNDKRDVSVLRHLDTDTKQHGPMRLLGMQTRTVAAGGNSTKEE